MEQDSSLFSLPLDERSKAQLNEVAKWARIFAVAGIVAMALIAVNSFYTAKLFVRIGTGEQPDTAERAGEIAGVLLVCFIPLLAFAFVLRFATALKKALEADDSESLTRSFQNLKIYFRYVGIIAIIFAVLMAVSFLVRLL